VPLNAFMKTAKVAASLAILLAGCRGSELGSNAPPQCGQIAADHTFRQLETPPKDRARLLRLYDPRHPDVDYGDGRHDGIFWGWYRSDNGRLAYCAISDERDYEIWMIFRKKNNDEWEIVESAKAINRPRFERKRQ
jgi:hypothetical protein